MRWGSRDPASQLRSNTGDKNVLVMAKVVAFDGDYGICQRSTALIRAGRDRATATTGISSRGSGERYGVPKSNVVKEEVKSRDIQKCIKAFINDERLEWKGDSSHDITSYTT